MSAVDDSIRAAGDESTPADHRLVALEREVAALKMEVAGLRSLVEPAREPAPDVASASPPFLDPKTAAALRMRPAGSSGARDDAHAPPGRPSFAQRLHSEAAISGVELESMVGRYGTLSLAAVLVLMGVGAIIKMAVEKGLLTPEVRVLAGLLVAVLLAVAGFVFRGRGEVRYGGVLLALSLAVVDLVAWGAGPRFHLVPVVAALTAVDMAAVALAALALKDQSEFLLAVSVAGALSAPFVTSDGGGTALSLLLYGGVVLAGALRAVRNPEWTRAFAVLVIGALVYSLAAAALPVSTEWYGPYLIALFGAACAAAALLFGEPEWKSELPRAYLGVTVVGVLVAWDAVNARPLAIGLAVSLAVAAVTYAALLARQQRARHWTASAILLPLVSLGIAYASAGSGPREAAVLALWAVFSLIAWRVEHAAPDDHRAGAHLLTAGILGCLAVTAWLWGTPLAFVAGLAAWGATLAGLSREEGSPLRLGGVCLAIGAAAISAVDQLASRSAYSYTPFMTRSSASAFVAAVGIGVAGELLASGGGEPGRVAARPLRLGILIGFLIVWGRMEMAQAFNADLASFLLTSYYAACGVGCIIAGRTLGIARLRVGGLILALYAAVKAVVVVTDISSLSLRVGAYAAVGVFLLGAGYLYREQRDSEREAAAPA
ncbi:hypothetical protein BH09GEM1_BH09GEM1_44030 [soil metagenome]